MDEMDKREEQTAEEKAKEAWAFNRRQYVGPELAAFRATRDEELERLVKQSECIHGAPYYKECRTLEGEHLWCELCGNLGKFGNHADAGHQIDLPDETGDGRGFGYTWAEPDWRRLTQLYVGQTLLSRAKAAGDKEGIATVEIVLRQLREGPHA